MDLRHDDTPTGPSATTIAADSLLPQILVVDDTNEVRNVIALFLRRCGYRVLTAEDGLAAQLLLLGEPPSLVISDLEMPLGDGWDLLKFCHVRHPTLPVLLVSGTTLGRRPDIECWATGSLPKPFALDQLGAEVRRLLALAA